MDVDQSGEAPEVRPEAPETGDPRVDAVLAPLAALANEPVSDHAALYDDVHRGLQDALADLDRA